MGMLSDERSDPLGDDSFSVRRVPGTNLRRDLLLLENDSGLSGSKRYLLLFWPFSASSVVNEEMWLVPVSMLDDLTLPILILKMIDQLPLQSQSGTRCLALQKRRVHLASKVRAFR